MSAFSELGALPLIHHESINGTATMSIFSELGIPARMICYCVMHQTSLAADLADSQKGLGESLGKVKYYEELKAFLHNTLAEAAAIRDAFHSSLLEARNKSAQVAM